MNERFLGLDGPSTSLLSLSKTRAPFPKIRFPNAQSPRQTHFVLIERQRLWQECLSHSIALLHPGISLVGCDSIESYLECYLSQKPSGPGPDAIILRFNQAELADPEIHAATRSLVRQAAPVPVVVLAATEDLDQMGAVLDCGVKGYIPASIGLVAIVDAIRMAASGGFMLTGPGLAGLCRARTERKPVPDTGHGILTPREAAVAEALRQGKPNKIIAYELGMRENTVKVHVRKILKKLNVSNRTEAAFRLNELHAA